MHADSSRVVASWWNVSEVATAQLMANFYRAMEKEKLPPAAALRSAQVALWNQRRWSSPYFWASFQIQGDWNSLVGSAGVAA
jgi:CHAT domain-containing protein